MLARAGTQLIAIVAFMLLSDATGGPTETPQAARLQPFTFATVERLARERAARSYSNDSPALPASLARLGYDQYRDIRFKPDRALWRGRSLFEVQFFHRGFNFERRVNVFEVAEDGVARQIPYSTALFDFGPLVAPANAPAELGFAGFRVHFPLHTPLHKDELIVFLGASYFRVLGRNQVYGLSARGLAVNAATERGEEFPYFTDFWLVRPERDDRTLTIYALLDSDSVAGAYRFQLRPGAITQVEVTSRLFPRKTIEKVGVAPLSSMFLYGEDPSGHRFDDFRPEVHDSDALIVQTGGGEWLQRPLVNPRGLRVSRLVDAGPRGFGLAQRDRDFAHYEDNESRFDRRPSYWIEPLGRWGKGSVELIEIPAGEEIHDNVAAYWVPDGEVAAGAALTFSYLLHAYVRSSRWPPGGKAIATRIGSAAVGGYRNELPEGMRRFVIDFAGGDLDGLHQTQPVKAVVTASGGTVDAVAVERMPETGAWRVAFRMTPNGDKPVDLRCYLSLYGEALTETWIYLWSPEK